MEESGRDSLETVVEKSRRPVSRSFVTSISLAIIFRLVCQVKNSRTREVSLGRSSRLIFGTVVGLSVHGSRDSWILFGQKFLNLSHGGPGVQITPKFRSSSVQGRSPGFSLLPFIFFRRGRSHGPFRGSSVGLCLFCRVESFLARKRFDCRELGGGRGLLRDFDENFAVRERTSERRVK